MIRFILIIIIISAGIYVGMNGLTAVGMQIANLPVKFNESLMMRNVPYGSKQHQLLDVYYPSWVEKGNLPVIVFFYGGRWQEGSKDQYVFLAETLTKKGFVVAIPDYAKYPPDKFPTFVQDGAKAVSYIHENASSLGLDPSRIFVSGHSSGAYIGAMLSVDKRYLQQTGCTRDCVRAFAGLAGPYALTPDQTDLKIIFGREETFPQIRVPTFVDGEQPPLLSIYGEDDSAVDAFHHERLAEAIRKKGGVVDIKTYPGIGHIGLIGSFSWILSRHNTVVDDISAYFEAYPSIAPDSSTGTPPL